MQIYSSLLGTISVLDQSSVFYPGQASWGRSEEICLGYVVSHPLFLNKAVLITRVDFVPTDQKI